MRIIPPLFALTIIIATASSAHAEETEVKVERANSVNVSPLGVLFGSYNINYERLMGAHGVLVEGAFARATDEGSSSTSGGLSLGYRWHWRGRQNSGFLGVTLGYAMGAGDGSVSDGTTEKTFDVDTRVFSATANIGKRWAWDNGLNITLRGGAGYGNWSVSTDSTDPDAQEVVEKVDDLLTFLPVAVEGELSVGYAF